jgi:hypothetical protein
VNRTFDFYECAGFIIPGAVVVMAIVWLLPRQPRVVLERRRNARRARGNDNRGREGPGSSCKLQCRSSNGNNLGWRVRGGPTEGYQGISNTWLVYGYVSSRPLSPATQSVSVRLPAPHVAPAAFQVPRENAKK